MKARRNRAGKRIRWAAPLVALPLSLPALIGTARAQERAEGIRPLQVHQEKLAREAGAATVALGRARRGMSGAPDLPDGQTGGSGFIIDDQGHILTEAGRAPTRGEITVTLRGGHRAKAHFVAQDARTHVALLKLDDAAGTAQRLGGKLPVLSLGRSSELKLGRVVATVGNPFESLQTDGMPALSVGVVSSLGRLRDADAYKGYVIETDAAVNPGSFGGPLVDAEGRVVGLVLEAYSPKRWFGCAVPSDEIALVLEDLKAGRAPRPPRLGLTLTAAGEATKGGLVVASVEKDGPAARAGIKTGDRLRSFDGARVAEAYDVERELAPLAQGTPVELEVARGGDKVVLKATLDAGDEVAMPGEATPLPEAPAPARPAKPAPAPEKSDGKPWAGLNVEDREGGVYISQIVDGGPAEKAGLKVGDRLVSVNGQAVKGREDMRNVILGASPGDKLSLKIERDGWQKGAELVLGSKGASGEKSDKGEKPGTGEQPDRPRRGRDRTPPPAAPAAKRAFLGVGPDQEYEGKGFKIATVAEGSAAEKAKLKAGDTILSIDGKEIEGFQGPKGLVEIMKAYKAGDKVKLHIDREGWERDLSVELGERPPEADRPPAGDDDDEGEGDKKPEAPKAAPKKADKAEKPAAPRPWLGIAVLEKGGVLVVDDVAEGSPAAKAKIQKGDVVAFDVKGKVVKPATADELGKLLADMKPGDTLVLVVDRDGWTKKTSIQLGERPANRD